jgi:hypothetical protein
VRFVAIALYPIFAPSIVERVPPQIYAVMTERGVSGSGFLISFEDEVYAVAPLDPTDSPPTVLFAMNGAEVQVGSRVASQKGIQVLRIERRLSDSSSPFDYSGSPALEAGTRLGVVNQGEVIEGILRSASTSIPASATSPPELEIEASKPFHVLRSFGAPVVSLESGAVVGVVMRADEEGPSSTVRFEPLVFRGETGPEWVAGSFVGSWVTGSSAVVTVATLDADGSFVARWAVGSTIVGKVSGRWEFSDREIGFTYDENSGFPVGRDVNRVLSVSKSEFTIRQRDGGITVFTRKVDRPD